MADVGNLKQKHNPPVMVNLAVIVDRGPRKITLEMKTAVNIEDIVRFCAF